jgi:hypothetical protein
MGSARQPQRAASPRIVYDFPGAMKNDECVSKRERVYFQKLAGARQHRPWA